MSLDFTTEYSEADEAAMYAEFTACAEAEYRLRVIEVRCDAQACPMTATGTAAILQKGGWKLHRGSEWCPEHSI